MAVDSRQQQPHIYGYTSPHFTNPWNNPAVTNSGYPSTQPPTSLDQQQRNLTLPPYNALPVTTTAISSAQSILSPAPFAQSVSQQQYPQYQNVTAPGYINLPENRAAGFGFTQADQRRPSHHFDNQPQTHDVVDASRQILSLSQNDITPTPRMYAAAQNHSSRSSPESYGFPSTHSTHSSISSASGVHSSYGSSVGDYSLTDYSSAGESVDLNHHRTLPRPSNALGSGLPPAPQSMMGQFSSKVSSSTQKKHKCKICDKRFTRPSSLQTHIYSHTGEKPFACEVEGCGRNFSVVSNLRRHKKVHKSQGTRDQSPDDS